MVIDKVKNFCLKFDKVILFIFLCVVFIKSKPEHGLVISIAFVFAFLCVYLGYVQLRKFLFSGNKYSEKKVNLISAIPFSILFFVLFQMVFNPGPYARMFEIIDRLFLS